MRAMGALLRISASAAAAGATAAAVASLWLIVTGPIVVAQAIADRDAVIVARELATAFASAVRALLSL